MRPTRQSQHRFAAAIAAFLALFLILSIDYRPRREGPVPEVISDVRGTGPLEAGAGKVSLEPPFPTPLAGYSTRGQDVYLSVLDAPQVRAIVVGAGGKRVALVSLELLLVPAALRAKVVDAVKDTGVAEVVLTATHTHSGTGGFWDNASAGWLSTGTFDPKIEGFLVERTAEAIRAAVKVTGPAKVGWATIEASHFSRNRNRDPGPVDPQLSALRIDRPDGTAIARLVVFAAHPTILPRDLLQLSADWPGAFSASLEETSGGAPVLFVQGALGDATWGKRAGELVETERVVRFGRALAADARGAIAAASADTSEGTLALTRVLFTLPPADAGGILTGPLEGVGSNVLQWMLAPGASTVSVLRLGPASLAFVPGEPVAELGIAWRKALGGAAIVALADDYVGYVEEPGRVDDETGETARQFLDGRLAGFILEALQRAAKGL